ncbi:hypothetical protein NRIC_27590 [Enterococcus florum]|uniref:Uncharacterized protein n=1 Tax=Enterococcus florum TaxID=2480627 RepID=A0A4P5PF64_9ENTE|nr:hypothetical protein NRIC_27590 [Enterococcus florum]
MKGDHHVPIDDSTHFHKAVDRIFDFFLVIDHDRLGTLALFAGSAAGISHPIAAFCICFVYFLAPIFIASEAAGIGSVPIYRI